MIKIENVDVFGWEAAIRGMRNPMNSWEKSDTHWIDDEDYEEGDYIDEHWKELIEGSLRQVKVIGKNDLKLMKTLSKAGSDHGKFLRMINVTFDLTAPLYFFKEWDTYKVGTVANSCSTMHKIHAKEFTLDDFSCEHLIGYDEYELPKDSGINAKCHFRWYLEDLCDALNNARELYLATKDKVYWWQMIQLLPSSYNQKRTVQLNYQVLKSMYFARKEHRLDEWHDLCDWMLTLPYFKEICVDVVDNS